MALQVAERAVVGDDLEAVAQRLEAAAGPVAAVAPARRRGRRAARRARPPTARPGGCACSSSDAPAASKSSAASSASSSPSTCSRRTDGRASASPASRSRPSRRDPAVGGALARLQVGDPLAAAVGPLDARDEARHHGLDRLEDHPAVRRAPRAAGGPAGAGSAARRSGRWRRCPCARATRRGAGRAGGRAPWPGSRAGGRRRIVLGRGTARRPRRRRAAGCAA